VDNGQNGKFVYIVGADHRISPRDVVAGPQYQDEMVIEKGVNPGETVVVEEDEKRLAPGMLIEILPPSA
jgi:membrane fusion protein, multidrug efflux system